MSVSELRSKIMSKKATLAVIGLGYVGLPLACQLAQVGFDVLGIEVREDVIQKVNQGISPIEGQEPGLAELLANVISSRKLRATGEYSELRYRDIILIAVETPVDNTYKPRYQALRDALSRLGLVLKQEALVIIESTIAPGTISKLVIPILEQSNNIKLNRDFYLGHCP